ncbi:hypothetical protein MMC27_002429 [Xylographa pallens]|nr:hypothetical protein [Xylographa pallens]
MMDRLDRTEAITLLNSPRNLADQVEELEHLDERAINQALDNIQDPCLLPYSKYVELTSYPDTFTSWISPFLSDNNCTRAALALSIPYLDHTGPQPTSHEIDDDEYPKPHQSYNEELARFPEPRPYINYELVQILYGLGLDYGFLDRNNTGCFTYLQGGRDLYYKTSGDLQKTSLALQSVIIASEMMEKEEKSITDQMKELEKMLKEKATEAQARTESGGHTADDTVGCSNFSLTSDCPSTVPPPAFIPVSDTRASTPPAFVHEDSALTVKHNALHHKLLINHSVRTRIFYEMSLYQWKVEKQLKRRDRASQSLSALKQRFIVDELPLLSKIGKWYCKQEKEKERLRTEKSNTAEGDIEMEEAEKCAEEEYIHEKVDWIEAWDRDDEVLMDFETAAAEFDG